MLVRHSDDHDATFVCVSGNCFFCALSVSHGQTVWSGLTLHFLPTDNVDATIPRIKTCITPDFSSLESVRAVCINAVYESGFLMALALNSPNGQPTSTTKWVQKSQPTTMRALQFTDFLARFTGKSEIRRCRAIAVVRRSCISLETTSTSTFISRFGQRASSSRSPVSRTFEACHRPPARRATTTETASSMPPTTPSGATLSARWTISVPTATTPA